MSKAMKKKPETRTVFGITCNATDVPISGATYWKGEDNLVNVSVFDRDKEDLTQFTKRFLIIFRLLAFNNLEVRAEGTTLREAQHNMYGALTHTLEQMQGCIWKLQERKAVR